MLIWLCILPFFLYWQGKHQGAIIACGGNITSPAIYKEFMRRTDGHIAVITTASPSNKVNEDMWRAFGATHVYVIDGPEEIPPDATGVWIMGGDQALLEAAYVGGPTERALHRIVADGGVVAGTSAGAAILSRVMIRGDKNGGPDIGSGLSLLPWYIIDQHFTQRNRIGRLRAACKRFPRLTGAGIDENTALIVEKGAVRAVGTGRVLMIKGGGRTRVLTAP